jgi:phosphopantetheinyl transferase
MLYLHAQFCLSGPIELLIIAAKPKIKARFHAVDILLFNIPHTKNICVLGWSEQAGSDVRGRRVQCNTRGRTEMHKT